MLKLLFFTLFLFSSLYANKVIYFSYDNIPKRVIKGEIFPVTLKSLSTVKDFEELDYSFSNTVGLKLLTDEPLREKKGKYFYDTFYFLSTKKWAKLPDVEASLFALEDYNTTMISGDKINIVTLNPKKNFSNIVANNFELVEYKTTNYDNKYNIVIFVASAQNCDISAIKFNNVYKQGIASITESHTDSRVTYYLIVDKQLENFSFSYFNLIKNKFSIIDIPIIVEDDSVTTQTDLKPKDQSRQMIKVSIAAITAFVFFILAVWRKKYVYLIFILIPLIYVGYILIPEKNICIKKGSGIRLLPVENGTIFETTTSRYTLTKEGKAQGFLKVKLHNEKIGWVKNEDTCSY